MLFVAFLIWVVFWGTLLWWFFKPNFSWVAITCLCMLILGGAIILGGDITIEFDLF